MENVINKSGFQFVDFIKMSEAELSNDQPLAGSFSVIRCEGKTLLCYNKWREQWELPAGSREGDETLIQCAVRELYEETGQHVPNLIFKGLLKVNNLKNDRIKYNPVYCAEVTQLTPFIKNDETTDILLWDGKEAIGYIDAVDLKILDYV